MFIGQRAGDPETEMFCGRCHSRHQEERVVHGDLDPSMNGGIGPTLINVIRTKDVGEKQTVKFPTL
jgi:hypothetical protein